MPEYELEPTQRLQYLIERRATVTLINEESLDLFLQWRSDKYPRFWRQETNFANVANQITAMELALARLDREIAELKAEIARGSEQQDSDPEPTLPDNILE